MLSVIEISIAGDAFLFYNDMSTRELEKVEALSEQFRKQGNASIYADSSTTVKMFCSEVMDQLRLCLQPVAVAAVITLK